MHQYRTHTCGELRKEHVGQTVRISGWVNTIRDHGGVLFIDLRDHYGITQAVISPDMDFYKDIEHWRVETVLCFTGQVVARDDAAINPKLATGEIELVAEQMRVLADLGEGAVQPYRIFYVLIVFAATLVLYVEFMVLDSQTVLVYKINSQGKATPTDKKKFYY